MGTLFVLVSTCFKENVVVTCKIWSFLCSLDDLLQKKVIGFFVCFFVKSNFKMALMVIFFMLGTQIRWIYYICEENFDIDC